MFSCHLTKYSTVKYMLKRTDLCISDIILSLPCSGEEALNDAIHLNDVLLHKWGDRSDKMDI